MSSIFSRAVVAFFKDSSGDFHSCGCVLKGLLEFFTVSLADMVILLHKFEFSNELVYLLP